MTLNQYAFKADYYDTYEDKEETAYAIVFGKNYADVMEKIAARFPELYHLEINQLFETDFVWLNEKNYNLVKDDQDDRGLDIDEPEEEKIEKCGPEASRPDWPNETIADRNIYTPEYNYHKDHDAYHSEEDGWRWIDKAQRWIHADECGDYWYWDDYEHCWILAETNDEDEEEDDDYFRYKYEDEHWEY